MDPDFVPALGVILLQLRTARRALEDVQRSTSRYMGSEFAMAMTDGTRFGAPPLFEGALKVHVVNINDLAPGNSFGGFIESLFGGIGNFFSNLLGGAVGGFLTSLALPEMIERLERIVANLKAIVDRLGIGETKKEEGKSPGETPSKPQAQANTGETLLTTMEGLSGTIKAVTALFEAAMGGPEAANKAGETSGQSVTREGRGWMAILDGVNGLLDRAAYVLNAVNLLIPNVVGGLALLVSNLGAIRQAILETIQFILRNALILRGVVLTVVFETVASAARLAAAVVGMLGTTIQSMLTSIIGAVHALLGAVFDALGALTDALQAIVKSLLEWMVTEVFKTLRALGELSVFRTIDHLIRILPSLLPPIFALMTKGDKELPSAVTKMLVESHEAGMKGANAPAVPPTPVIIGSFPDIGAIMKPLEAKLASGVDETAKHLQKAAEDTFGTAKGTLSGLAGRFEGEVGKEADFSKGVLDKHVTRIRGDAGTLADTISKPLDAKGPDMGLETLATAYQDWLVGGGMAKVLGVVEKHITDRPPDPKASGIRGLLRGEFDRPRASIEIDRVEIVLEPPPDPAEGTGGGRDGVFGPGDFPMPSDEQMYAAVMRYAAELEERVLTPWTPGAIAVG